MLIVVTGFWLTMNVLLQQTQFGSRKGGGTVPVETVWEKILTAADDSSLTIFQKGKLIGACHLRTAVGEEWSKISDANVPAGAPEKNHGYRLRLDGSAVITELTNRVRFDGELKLSKKRLWESLEARVTMRPMTCEIESVASEGNVHLKVINGAAEDYNTVLRFSDLENPGILVYKLFGPYAADLVAEAGLQSGSRGTSPAGVGLKWEAYEDSIRIGHTAVQVYRLRTRVMDRYEISAIVSRAGEILQVDLPDKVTLVNDRLAATTEGRHAKGQTKFQISPSGIPKPND